MKKRLFLTVINLFFFLGELLIFVARALMFLILLPWLLYKCIRHGICHGSAAATWQMIVWVWDEYWILKK